jgi:UDP-N-acetylmuramyl tripeptide synthase
MTAARIVLLNLFRDQLDRYGEVDVIVEKWQKALSNLPKETVVILNSDDPGIASLGKSAKGQVIYFGINQPKKFLTVAEHATDSTFCPTCGNRFTYDGIYFSHLGIWRCLKCGNARPKPDVSEWPNALSGLYNQYNTLAAVATVTSFPIPKTIVIQALKSFTPAFGRQEEIVMGDRRIKLFLSKNPAGFNASLRTVIEQKAEYFLFALNDRIPDGRDVSWIWDVDFETVPKSAKVTVSGDRTYDLALRLKYAGVDEKRLDIEPTLMIAISDALANVPKGKTLYVLPTYSAMLDIREIVTGRKIL